MKPATLFICAPKNHRQYINHTCMNIYINTYNKINISGKIHSFHSISFSSRCTRNSKKKLRRDHEEDHCSHKNIIIIKCSSKNVVFVGWILELEIQDLFVLALHHHHHHHLISKVFRVNFFSLCCLSKKKKNSTLKNNWKFVIFITRQRNSSFIC